METTTRLRKRQEKKKIENQKTVELNRKYKNDKK